MRTRAWLEIKQGLVESLTKSFDHVHRTLFSVCFQHNKAIKYLRWQCQFFSCEQQAYQVVDKID
jgi:hypothetical protein